jgi:hypothetical protein
MIFYIGFSVLALTPRGLGSFTGLVRRTDLVPTSNWRPQSGDELRIERAQGCRNSRPDSHDPFFNISAKQCDPKIAAKEELGAAHCGRATGMGCAINLHLLDRWRCIIEDAAPTRSGTLFVHLSLQRAAHQDRT